MIKKEPRDLYKSLKPIAILQVGPQEERTKKTKIVFCMFCEEWNKTLLIPRAGNYLVTIAFKECIFEGLTMAVGLSAPRSW